MLNVEGDSSEEDEAIDTAAVVAIKKEDVSVPVILPTTVRPVLLQPLPDEDEEEDEDAPIPILEAATSAVGTETSADKISTLPK